MKFVIFSCSLDAASRSYLLAREAETLLERSGHSTEFVDLRSVGLPQFDNGDSFANAEFMMTHRRIEEADGVVLASPVYNWGLGGAAKNLIELTGATGAGRKAAWFDKVVTFLCAGGLPHSYMAYGPAALSLMLDFKCIINPYAVYSTDRDFDADHRFSERLAARIAKTIQVKIELTEGLSKRRYRSDWEV